MAERPRLPPGRWLGCLAADLAAAVTTPADAVYLVSFPKCGVTWLKLLVSTYLSLTAGDEPDSLTIELEALSARLSVVPWIIPTHDSSEIVLENGIRPDPRVLFGYHRRFRYLRHRVILLVRDPRDVVVSHFHQATKRSVRPFDFPSLGAFVRDPLYGFERVLELYSIWRENLETPEELLLVRYEDLRTDGETELARILRFVGVTDVRPELVHAALETGRFENLQALERQRRVAGMRAFGSERDALKARRGKVGGYRDELAPEDIGFCEERMRARLDPLYGYRPHVAARAPGDPPGSPA